MAADVRKDETYAENLSIVSESVVDQLSSISLESDCIDGEVPTYAIVHQQMRDVLGFQKAASDLHLRSNIDALNASKQCLNNTLECQSKTIRNLEVSIKNDYVLKGEAFELQVKLQEERNNHAETRKSLDNTLDKLDACQKEAVAALSHQRQTEQAAFEKCCDSLREDIQQLKTKNRELKSFIGEKTVECDGLKALVLKQEEELNQLRNKNESQRVKFKQKVSESDVEKRQEAYLRQMMSEEGRRRKDSK